MASPAILFALEDVATGSGGQFAHGGLACINQGGVGASVPHAANQIPAGDFEAEVDVRVAKWNISTLQQLLGKHQSTALGRSWVLWISPGAQITLSVSADGNNSTNFVCSTTTGLVDGARTVIKAVFRANDGGVSSVTFFKDGVQFGTKQVAGAVVAPYTGNTAVPLSVGIWGDLVNNALDGIVYRATARNGVGGTAFFDADFTTRAQGTASFAEASANAATVTINGKIAADSSGNLRDGLYLNGVTPAGGGAMVGAASGVFDGGSGRVRRTSPTMTANAGGGAAWVRPAVFSSRRTISSKSLGSGAGGWHFRITTAGKAEIVVFDGSGVATTATGTSVLGERNFRHVGWSYDNANLKLFVDGVAEATVPAVGALATNTTDVLIGALNPNVPAEFFFGPMDDVRVYTATPTDADMLAAFKTGRGIMCGPTATVTDATARVGFRASWASTVKLKYGTSPTLAGATTTAGVAVTAATDYSGKVDVSGLAPDTTYYYDLLVDDVPSLGSPFPSFRTFPAAGSAGVVSFAFSSCRGGTIAAAPGADTAFAAVPASTNLLFQIGDDVYDDIDGTASTTLAGFRAKHQASMAGDDAFSSSFRDLRRRTPVFEMWDDHDLVNDFDGGTGHALFAPASQAWREYAGPANPDAYRTGLAGPPYYAVRCGDVGFFVLDHRSYRSPSESVDDEGKTLLGAPQLADLKAWLLSVNESCTIKVVVSPTPAHGYASNTQNDSWGGIDNGGQTPAASNGYRTERNALWDWIDANGISGVVIVSGDQHWAGAFKTTYAGRPRYEFMASPYNQYNLAPPARAADPVNGPIFWKYSAGVNFGLVTINTTVADPLLTFQLYSPSGSLGPSYSTTLRLSELDQGLANAPGADTAGYLSVAEAAEIAASLPAVTLKAWAAAGVAEQAAALELAAADVDAAGPWQGRKYDPEQVLEFPRVAYETLPGPFPMAGTRGVADTVWDWDEESQAAVVPVNVKRAVLYQANEILAGVRDAMLDARHNGLASQSAAGMSESYRSESTPTQGLGVLARRAATLVDRYRLKTGRLL